jgi:hypothetical protein
MPTYAKDTDVTADRSRSEIEHTLERYGATGFAYGWADIGDRRLMRIDFQIDGRHYRIVLPLPGQADTAFTHTPARGLRRSPAEARAAWEQAVRQRWRALALWIKAVLEAQEAGITTIQEAMQPFTVLPSGQTAGEWLAPQIQRAYESGTMPALLPGLGKRSESGAE